MSLGPSLLAHVFPVTVYHVERFVWETGPDRFDWKEMLPRNRPLAAEVGSEGVGALWLQRITPDEAIRLADWLGGRLPTREEYRSMLAADAGLLPSGLTAADRRGDARISDLVRSLASLHQQDQGIPAAGKLSEYATEFGQEPRGRIFFDGPSPDSKGEVTANSLHTFRRDHIGFRCVFTRDSLSLNR